MEMKQALLSKGGYSQVAWIDSKAAIPGYRVELKKTREFWDVEKVFPLSVSADSVLDNERNYSSHRKATDI